MLSYNNNISLFAVGANTHIFGYGEIQSFKKIIEEYNRELEKLCDKYGFDYVPSYGSLTDEILEHLYDKKIWNPQSNKNLHLNSGKKVNDNSLYNTYCDLQRELRLYSEDHEPDFVKKQKRMILERKIDVIGRAMTKKR